MKKNNRIFRNILIGIIPIILAGVLLWFNEQKRVVVIKSKTEVKDNMIQIKNDKINLSNNGKLVWTTGTISTSEIVEDITFDISLDTTNYVRLVEVYQWKETKSSGGTYSYQKVWNDEIIDSSKFKDQTKINPTRKPYDNRNIIANKVHLGEFVLSKTQKEKLLANKSYELLSTSIAESINYKINGKYYVNSENFESPQIGDTRISFSYNDTKEITVLAVQSANTFANYITSFGDIVNEIALEKTTGESLIKTQKKDNIYLPWIIRMIGALLSITGWLIIFKGITSNDAKIPFLNIGLDNLELLFGLLFGGIYTLIIVSIAWLTFQPIIPILSIATVSIFVFIIVNKAISRKKEIVIKDPTIIENTPPLIEKKGNSSTVQNMLANDVTTVLPKVKSEDESEDQ